MRSSCVQIVVCTISFSSRLLGSSTSAPLNKLGWRDVAMDPNDLISVQHGNYLTLPISGHPLLSLSSLNLVKISTTNAYRTLNRSLMPTNPSSTTQVKDPPRVRRGTQDWYQNSIRLVDEPYARAASATPCSGPSSQTNSALDPHQFSMPLVKGIIR